MIRNHAFYVAFYNWGLLSGLLGLSFLSVALLFLTILLWTAQETQYYNLELIPWGSYYI